MLIIAKFVFRRAMKVDLLVEHFRATVAMPEVDDRGWFVTLEALLNKIIGIRIHGAAGASWTNIAHLRIGGTSCSSAGSTPLVGEILVSLVLQELFH